MLLFYSFLIICKMVRFHTDTYLISLCRVRICYRTSRYFWHVYEKPLRCVVPRIRVGGEPQPNVCYQIIRLGE